MAGKNISTTLMSTVLIGTILLAMLSAGYLGFKRHVLEAANRQVELAVEYAEVMQVVRQSGLSYEEVLRRLKESGATGLFFKEQALEDWSQDVWLKIGSELLLDPGLTPALKKQLKPEYTYLLTMDKNVYDRLAKQLRIKVPKTEAVENLGGPYLVGTTLSKKYLEGIGLGFPEDDMLAAENLGYNLQVQIKSWPQVENTDLAAFFSSLAKFKNLDLVLFNDKTIPGFPGKYLLLADEIKKLNVPIGFIEFYPQKGFKQLAAALDKQVIRLHSIDKTLMLTTDPNVAIDRYTLAVTDRNIRAILVRLLFKQESTDWLQDNVNYLSSVQKSIVAQGFTLGKPAVLEGPGYQGILVLLVGLGVVAGGVLLLRMLGWRLLAYGLGVLAALGWLGLIASGHTLAARKLLALGSVVIFPSLAVLLNLEEQGASVGRSIMLLLRTSVISLIGALLTVGLLADVSFMLKLEQFSGVKAAHVLPLAIIITILFLRSEKKNAFKSLTEFLGTKITVGYAILAGVMVAALFVYIMRTGNEAAPVTGLELQIRSWLDRILVVRPRTKEFLIGHPVMLLTFYLGYKHRLLPVLLLGVIGQISMVNTFAHIHTPVAISLFRAFNGLWLGIVIGVVVIFAYRFVLEAGRRLLHG